MSLAELEAAAGRDEAKRRATRIAGGPETPRTPEEWRARSLENIGIEAREERLRKIRQFWAEQLGIS